MLNTPFTPDKVIAYHDRLRMLLNGQIPPPVTVEIDPTDFCSSNCIWCFYKDKRTTSVLKPKRTKLLLNELKDMGVYSVTFTGGGEPTCSPFITRFIKHACNIGLKVGLITNGNNFNYNLMNILVSKARFVRISLDAGTSKTFNKLKLPNRKDQWDKTINDIKYMVKKKYNLNSNIDIGLSFLVHPHNYTEVYKFLTLAQGLGVSYAQIKPCIGYELTNNIVDSVDKQYNDFISKNNDFTIYYNKNRFIEIISGYKENRDFTKCLSNSLIGIVGADGNVYLCCQYRGIDEWSFGNIYEQSFSDIWYSDKHKEIIKKIDVSKCPPCRYNGYNTVIEKYILKDICHIDFL